MRVLFIFMVVFLMQLGYSQREANIWHFGDGVGLDFNSCEPETVFSEMNSSEGCTSIANSVTGELQFYTEGSTIWNRNHAIMSNGENLLGFRSATQASMIVKRPGNFNEYYVFTVDTQDFSNGLMYSVVNMDGDGGLGDVISKNIPLITPIVEKIHATRHANGEDIWVSVHGFGDANFYSFLVTSTGVNLIPVVSIVGSIISGNDVATIGAMKFSPDGKKLAICNYQNSVETYDFDNNTGSFSNPVVVTSRLYSYGLEFSRSNNILYVSTSFQDTDNKLLQYDLRAPTIEDSERLLLDLSDKGTIGSLQLGPDKKLYISINNRNTLSVINEPSRLGVLCDFVEDAISLGGSRAKLGLPLFLHPIFFNEMIVEEACFRSPTNFRLSENVEAVAWDFGDPDSGINNISTDLEPFHIFSQPGIYTVTTNIVAGCGPKMTITEEVEVAVTNIEVESPVQLVQCDNDSDGFSSFNLNGLDSKLSLNYENEIFTYYKTEDDALQRVNIISNTDSYENKISNLDTIWARIENNTGCFEIAEIDLIVSENDAFDAFEPFVFTQCDDNVNNGITIFDLSSTEGTVEGLFPAQSIDITYYRNLEDALAEINNISDISSYENIGYPYSQDIYVRVDSRIDNSCLGLGLYITLEVFELPQFELDEDLIICKDDEGSNITISVSNPLGNYNYEWVNENDSSVVLSTDDYITVSEGGIYSVVATYDYGARVCESYKDEVTVTEYRAPILTYEMFDIIDNSNNNTIAIDEAQLGTGDFEYALDNELGIYQDEPFFENVAAGVHTIYVRGKNDCKPNALEISIIGFPKFFTPNNDTQNDKWNLKGFGNHYSSNSKVFIYDRYGKLIKQITPIGDGWDGTFNGENLSQSDYWFVAELVNLEGNTRTLRGHFSLIR